MSFSWRRSSPEQEIARHRDLRNLVLLHERRSGAKTTRAVYACDDVTGARVVLKLSRRQLPPTGHQPPPLNCVEEAAMLMRLADRAAGRFVPEVLGAGHLDDDFTFLIEPFYPDEGIAGERHAGSVLRSVLQAIGALAECGVLHRDIRLENLRVRGDAVRLVDFNRALEVASLPADLRQNSDVTGKGPFIVPGTTDPHTQPQSVQTLVAAVNERFGYHFDVSELLDSVQPWMLVNS